ncbi:hypothetical protein DPM33_15115 [Mesorhizobium hawassense]|uniref:Helix-turn-helix domain-containing protein n=1 Tax=Mesorhizobium hawassense TaxID=1209954 RepID=A0A330HN75_9HYPH|nr:hypothetical protein [Mesorhizobium hawassense]RAZ90156.1 hypothetical protein DPM33_15115 [Mesorhizobium hawassense]
MSGADRNAKPRQMTAAEILGDLRSQLEGALERLAFLEAHLDRPAPSEPDWIDTAAAASRFGLSLDTVRWLARHKGCGRKDQGRWQVSVSAMQSYRTRMALAFNASKGPF